MYKAAYPYISISRRARYPQLHNRTEELVSHRHHPRGEVQRDIVQHRRNGKSESPKAVWVFQVSLGGDPEAWGVGKWFLHRGSAALVRESSGLHTEKRSAEVKAIEKMINVCSWGRSERSGLNFVKVPTIYHLRRKSIAKVQEEAGTGCIAPE